MNAFQHLSRLCQVQGRKNLLPQIPIVIHANFSSDARKKDRVDLKINDHRAMHKTYSEEEVLLFTKITGDSNPLHFDVKAAVAAGFDDILVPGILMVSLFPAIIGSAFPGAVYASQSVKFRSPAMVGQPLVAEVTVRKQSRGWVVFDTLCRSLDGIKLVEGEAMAKLS